MRIAALSFLAGFAALALVAAGCSEPAARRFDESLQHVVSNAAVMTMLGDAWCEGTVPVAYAVRTADRAQKNLGRLAGTLQSLDSIAADRREAALRITRDLESSVERAQAALQRQDRQAVLAALGELRLLESEARRQVGGGT